MSKSRVDEKQSIQLLEDNRLNEADIPELFLPLSTCLTPITVLLYSQSLILQPY